MKIELTAGCTLDSLLINGKRFETLPYNEIRNVITILLDYFKDTELCNDILKDIVYTKGDFTDGYKCEQCGDWVESYTLEI